MSWEQGLLLGLAIAAFVFACLFREWRNDPERDEVTRNIRFLFSRKRHR